jgi:short-subunit dehydrogenase
MFKTRFIQKNTQKNTQARPLAGQSVWITGASAGIGLALSCQAAKLGANVILVAPDQTGLQQAKQQCEQYGGQHMAIVLNVLDSAGCEAAYQHIIATYGKLDWLINNAGITHRSSVLETSEQLDDQIFALDYKAPVRLTRLVLQDMLRQQRGHIVMISSIVGLIGTQQRSSYAAAKSALHLWANSLRAEVESSGIQVKVVFPGFVNTNITVSALLPNGQTYGKVDAGQQQAMSAERFAAQAWQKMLNGQNYIVIGALKDKVGALLSRVAPELLYKVIRRVKVS